MHNRVSHNQLAGWNMTDNNQNLEINKIDDYFDCLIECADLPKRVDAYAKRIRLEQCTKLLKEV